MPRVLPAELANLQTRVEETARGYGLTHFPTCYEILDFEEMNMVASYGGFPVRYPHWKWGMEYERMSKNYEYGLGKIYEMVINNDPCYAYLLESNSMVDQKIVMCHVTAHNDFFKNNLAFRHTSRRMIDDMANHASRIRRYMDWYGVDEVESFVDKVLSIDNLIDYQSPYMVRHKPTKNADEEQENTRPADVHLLPADKEYMERYVNPDEFVQEQRRHAEEKAKKLKKFPQHPARDILGFLMNFAPLTRWQRDVVDMLREETYYFAPQAMTKIMNEGWASYWHAKLMTEKMMDSSEVVDFADRHSSVVAASRQQLNPYRLGIELYRDIEDRWNRGRFGLEWDSCNDMAERRHWDRHMGLGRDKIFQIRQIYTDVMFIDEFFTLDFCKRHGFFAYGYDKKRQEYTIESREFDAVKKKLLSALTNMGHPMIDITDANYDNRSELLLEHRYEGVDLDVGYGRETLKNIQGIWSRPVNLLTTHEEREVMWSYDGEQFKERLLGKQV